MTSNKNTYDIIRKSETFKDAERHTMSDILEKNIAEHNNHDNHDNDEQ